MPSITYRDLEEYLKNLTNKKKIKQSEIAKAAEMLPTTINYKKANNTEFTAEEAEKIIKYFKENNKIIQNIIKDNTDNIQKEYENAVISDIIRNGDSSCPYRMKDKCPCKEQFEIHYLECLPEEARLPEVTSVHKDAQIVKEHWHRDPENLRILPMQGDGLTTYWYPCLNRDILIIDINSIIPTREGLYAYSAKNNTMLFVAKLAQSMDGTIKIEKFEATGEVTQKIVSPEKQKEVDFRVIGRVVNNESLSL